MSTELVPTKPTSVAKLGTVATRIEVTRAVGEGIKALQVAFPLVSQTAEDRALSMKLYAEAVEGFHPAIQEYALKWLRLHNPRNQPNFTQPPTPQDVHECCESVRSTWFNRVCVHFIGEDRATGGRLFRDWGDTSASYFSSAKKQFPYGPAPFTEGCLIPGDLVCQFMREHTGRDYVQSDIVDMDEEHYAILRPAFFDAGLKEEIDSRRQSKAEKEAARRKHEAYLDSLEPDLREARSDVCHKYWRLYGYNESQVPAEDVLIAEAKLLVAQRAEERLEREAREARRKAEREAAERKRAEARDSDPEAYRQALLDRRIEEFYEARGASGYIGLEDNRARQMLHLERVSRNELIAS